MTVAGKSYPEGDIVKSSAVCPYSAVPVAVYLL